MKDKVLLPALILFSLLFLPFIDSYPHLDGNIDFVKSYDFYKGGIDQYSGNWRSVHPPLKFLITNTLYHIFGLNYLVFNLIGYILGLVGISALFLLAKKLFNSQIAAVAALLLASSPLFLSQAIFSLLDYLLTIFIIISLYFYSRKNFGKYAVFAVSALMIKESGILLPIIIIFIEIISFLQTKKISFHKIICLILPLASFYGWSYFLAVNHIKMWGDWIFGETADKGAMYTIVYNLITLKFLNQYTFSHWRQLLFLNFNWILLPVGLLGMVINFKKILIDSHDWQKIKTIIAIFLLIFANIFTVLAFPTYTIPRYGLPVIVLGYLFVAPGIEFLTIKFKERQKIIYLFFSLIIFLSLFLSIDPLATKIWGKTKVLGQDVYALNRTWAGNDGIAYNMQYLMILKKRTNLIIGAEKEKRPVLSDDCFWVFPDPNNDLKTLDFLNSQISRSNLCFSP